MVLVVLCAYFIEVKLVVPFFALMIQASVSAVQQLFIISGNSTPASEPLESS
jgi:hypothetical protein